MKKIVIAPDSFKGTMSSIEVCNIMENGIKYLLPRVEVLKVPIADGGEGTVDAFLTAIGGEKVHVSVKDPHFYDIEAFYGILPDKVTAVIEMASASGLPLAGVNRNPYLTTSYGTGQLIADALGRGCKEIILGIGGSATNDGGIGMAAALGIKYLNEDGSEIPLNGGGLEQLHSINICNLDKRLESCKITVACDVDNLSDEILMEKIVIAPDSFKGTMSSIEVCNIVVNAIKSIYPFAETVKIPMADGGEGTVDAFLSALGGEKIKATVKGPYFNDIDTCYGILPDNKTAVIEMAAASGLPLVGEERNPFLTTTFGVGQLIGDALDRKYTKIILGIGGSATNDGGVGMAAALGIYFLDENGSKIQLNGGGLGRLSRIDKTNRDKRLDNCEIIVVCDVNNPLCGKEGASYIFGPQKGANEEMVCIFGDNLRFYSDIIYKDCDIQVREIPGTGAAGGIAASLLAFTRCTIKSGISIMMDTVNFDTVIKDADLVITGEGRIDGQSLKGKVPVGIAERASKYNVPVIAIVGSIDDGIDELYKHGINAIFSIGRKPIPFEEAKLTCREDLYLATENIIRFSKIFKEQTLE